MKFLFTGIIAIMTSVSCAQNNEKDLLETIASDSLYHTYMKNIEESGHMVALGEYDMTDVHKLLEKNKGMCNYSKDDYNGIRGAEKYFAIHCEGKQLVNQLHEKYDYRNFDDVYRDKIMKLYREKYKDVDLEKIEKIRKRYVQEN